MLRPVARRVFLGLLVAGSMSAPAARASTVYVASNGLNSATCGAKATPCATITQAIHNAGSGDQILVGPGRYSGESGATGCDCFVAVDKPLTILSSNGAASTVIDARAFLVIRDVLISANGTQFGRPGKGFTVLNPGGGSGIGIEIDADDVKVQGNQVIADRSVGPPGDGILADQGNSGPILIQGNQVVMWAKGIVAVGPGRTVLKNQVSLNVFDGMVIEGTSFASGNVVSGNQLGVFVLNAPTILGNAIYGNVTAGVEVGMPFTGTITGNDFIGNSPTDNCGLQNDDVIGLTAAGNYWGASTGPGPNPADDACNVGASTTTTSPFAGSPFPVKAPIKP
jgi:copper-binding protein NosD/uncharacterized protein DUF1565